MRLMLEGFWVSDYVEAVLTYIKTGTFFPESPWQSKEKLISKLKDYDSSRQAYIYAEIKNFIDQIKLEVPNYKAIEQRIIEFLDQFELEIIEAGEKKYSYDTDLQLVINYIKTSIEFSETFYSSKEKFFEKLRHYEADWQQAIIREIRTTFSEKFESSFSGYVLSFIVASPIDPIEERAKEVLAVFDPNNLKLAMEQLANEDLSLLNQKCYVM